MDLNAYTPAHLQSTGALLSQAEAAGLTLPGLRDLLQAHLRSQLQAAQTQSAEPVIKQPSCPRCSSPLELQSLCPQVSPHWRTAVACISDGCSYYGLSIHPAEHLVRNGNGLAGQVEER